MNHIQPLQFTANARLKDIIGRGLIYDDNIAILELVKNSKDANSPSVSINFVECDKRSGESKLIISDHGQGMSLDDIKEKWLNIAYSEKRDIHSRIGGFYAGNKGIGRFSCDRLGKKLDIYTRSKGSEIIELHIDWEDFEINDFNKQISDIAIRTRNLSVRELEIETGKRDFSHGAVMVIRDLRSKWTKENLLSLRKELERFSIDPDNQFEVFLSHWKYDRGHIVNQPIKNKIFSDLDFRTTSISAKVMGDGQYLEIELRHAGDYIFKAQEHNSYSEIKELDARIYFLNPSSKAFFKRRTGYSLEQFGSIHLFLNGFRISPYGSFGNDWLGVNSRESLNRIIKTKDIVGFVKLTDTVGSFETVSSREGLVDNLGYRQLTAQCDLINPKKKSNQECGIIFKLINKLEKFVIEGLDWDKIETTECSGEISAPNGKFKNLEKNNLLLRSIAPVIRYKSVDRSIISITVNADYITRIAKNFSDDYRKEIEKLEVKLDGLPFDKLLPSEKRNVSKLVDRISETVSEKNKTIASLKAKNTDNEKRLKAEQKRRMFAEKFYSKDNEKIAQVNHQIGLLSLSSLEKLNWIGKKFREDSNSYTKNDLMDVLDEIQFGLRKIYKVANLVLKANFDLTNDMVEDDLVQFIDEYVKNYTDIADAYFLKISVLNS